MKPPQRSPLPPPPFPPLNLWPSTNPVRDGSPFGSDSSLNWVLQALAEWSAQTTTCDCAYLYAHHLKLKSWDCTFIVTQPSADTNSIHWVEFTHSAAPYRPKWSFETCKIKVLQAKKFSGYEKRQKTWLNQQFQETCSCLTLMSSMSVTG